MAQGVETTDFSDIVFADWKQSLIRTPQTQTFDNVTGDESFSDGTPAAFEGILLRRHQKWFFDKEGRVEGGDAYAMLLPAQTILINDKITDAQGNIYRVQDKIVRTTGPPDNADMYIYCNLFLVE